MDKRRLRIAVLSDTHDHCPPELPQLVSGASEVWHLGDVGQPSLLDSLVLGGAAVRVVRGNTDWCGDWPLSLDLERLGHRFHLVHIPPGKAPNGAAFLIHGHTHVPRDERLGMTRWLNPGAICGPREGTKRGFAWLEIQPGEEPVWRRVSF